LVCIGHLDPYLQHATCNPQPAIMRNATRNIQRAIMQHAIMRHATRNMQPRGSDMRQRDTQRCPFRKIHTVILKATTRPFRRGGRRRAKVPLRPPRPVASSGAMDESLAAPPRPVKATDDTDKGIDIALKVPMTLIRVLILVSRVQTTLIRVSTSLLSLVVHPTPMPHRPSCPHGRT
jgi:hypothetical protein